jgi:hypothetical protein
LKLLPGKSGESIACQLDQADVENSPAYEDILYVWGDHVVKCTIFCDGHPFAVTNNLFLATSPQREFHPLLVGPRYLHQSEQHK